MSWDLAQLPSFAGKTVVVTGGNSGIGFHTALELARRGADVTIACRDADRGRQAMDRIQALVPNSLIGVRVLNLASLQSVQAFAESWDGPLDLLVDNAGVMAPPKWRSTEDGFELQFGTNHLGHFALTGRLLPALLAAPAARVVSVSSLAHRGGSAAVLFGNPAEGYRPAVAYSNSKLANLLFGLELQRRAAGRSLTSTVAHPGVSNTNLFISGEGLGANPIIRAGGKLVGPIVLQSSAAGALPTLYAAAAAAPGSYSGPQWLGEWRGRPGPAKMSPSALDTGLAEQLWDLSEELTGVTYEWSV